jgi:drug/metabolite transporter (DMT)-like permease
LITTDGDFGAVASGQALGDVLYLIAAVSWAGYILYSKKKMDEQRWDPLTSAACIVAVTAILVVPPALTAGFGPSLSPESLWAVGYTAVFNTVIPFVLYQQGLRHLTASSSAVILMLEIVVAVLISVTFLGETFTAFAWAGALAVLASIFLVSGVEISGKSLSVPVTDVSRVEDT